MVNNVISYVRNQAFRQIATLCFLNLISVTYFTTSTFSVIFLKAILLAQQINDIFTSTLVLLYFYYP